MKPKTKYLLFFILLASVAVIGLLHTLTPGHMIFYHDTYRRLSYFPIAVGAVFFGLWGGLSLAIVSCFAFVPHLFLFWARGPEAYYSELSEIIFYLAAGIVIGLISSREHKLREQYKTLSEKLSISYQRLHEQALTLVEAEKQLGESQKLSMLGHVSASLAHELKNPLASIKGAAEILADELPEGHPKHEFIDIMRSEISRLNHSVEEVLDYCRGRQQESRSRQGSVARIIHHVVSLLAARFKEKSITISVQAEPGDDFFIDEAAMIQVLMNIILNAVDEVGKKGRIMVELDRNEKFRFIKISDDGPGIDAGRGEDIFQSFITFKEGGTGLGLSISKRIIESLGGKIETGTSLLGGALFSIVLPQDKFSGDGEREDQTCLM
ncbi:MAG: HAMP domain-containing sensor histidine kinase [Desulfobacula sp.]|jgi:signal transduction histidine kinase